MLPSPIVFTFLGSTKVYPCDLCGKIYTHKSSLWNHKKFVCGKTVAYFCKYCEVQTKYGFVLLKHVRDKHGLSLSKEEIEDALQEI